MVIHAENLTKSYGAFLALRGIDLTVQRGEVFGFLGPNGAGKTTTIRCMLDLIRPSGGSLQVLGKDPQKESVEVRAKCGYLPGELRLDENLRVRSALRFFSQLRGGGKAMLDRIGMLAERLGLDLNRKIKNLSKGNKQKIGIVAAFMHSPDLLMLDEPTSGLDPLVQQTVLELVREARNDGATVFFSSHVLAEVQSIADRVAIIREGEIVEVGTPAELTASSVVHVRVVFSDKAEFSTEEFSNISGVSVAGGGDENCDIEFGVVGSIDPLIKALSHYSVESLETRRPGLEEVFLTYYGEGESAAQRVGDQP